MTDEKTPAAEEKAAPKKASTAKSSSTKKATTAKASTAGSTGKTSSAKAGAGKTDAAKAGAGTSSAAKAGTGKTGTEKKPAARKPAASTSSASATDETTAKPASRSTARRAEQTESRPQILKAHHLRPAPGSRKARTRVGRGEGSKGKTAGRGTKGTKARYQVRAGLEGGNLNAVMRAPKLRGFTNPFRVEYQVVNLSRLAELYPQGGDVTVSDLVAKGAVRRNEKVKVLGTGDISVKLNVAVDKVSSSAEQKIVAAGGSVD